MNRTLPLCALLATLAACSGGGGAGGPKADLATEDGKTEYALGFTVGSNISRGKPFTAEQAASIVAGLDDALTSKPAQVDMPTYGPKVQAMMMARAGQPPGGPGAQPPAVNPAKAVEEKKKGEEFAEKAAKEPGAEKLASGLVFKSITPGTGASPVATDTVKVNYEGKLIDGTVFDASAKHGGPAEFPLNHVIPCWTEGVQKLKIGGKAQLVCPSSIAYGDMGHPPTIPGGSTLVFSVELLEIKPAAAQPAPGIHAVGGPQPTVVQGKDANGHPTIQIRPQTGTTPPPGGAK